MRPLGTYFSEILIVNQTFSFKKMHSKMSSAKWHRLCLSLNMLNNQCIHGYNPEGYGLSISPQHNMTKNYKHCPWAVTWLPYACRFWIIWIKSTSIYPLCISPLSYRCMQGNLSTCQYQYWQLHGFHNWSKINKWFQSKIFIYMDLFTSNIYL